MMSEPDMMMKTDAAEPVSLQDSSKNGTATPPPSAPKKPILSERKAFKEATIRHRAKQLEYLEQKLCAFVGFTRDRETKQTMEQRIKRRGKGSLTSVENIEENVAVGVVFNKSPAFINGTMRDYQVDALNWLISLYKNGLSGILADEMGLGKTIQSISMLGYLMNKENIKGPFLVIAPLTTLDNWMKEFAMFLPSAKVFKAHAVGDGQMAVLEKLKTSKRFWNVVVTSYEFMVRHISYFMRINFHYAILDEGHRAKNENTLFANSLRRCHIRCTIMLTGTPIHNNLHELWALLNLLMPLFFNNADDFDSWFKVEDCIDPQHEQTLRLQNLLKPLMLRRIKSEVCPDIPPKVRITLTIPPTEENCVWSRKLYDRDVWVPKSDGSMVQLRMAHVFSKLRQVTLHPFLIPGAEPIGTHNNVTEDIVNYSSKMIVLDALLQRLKERGSRVLIFTQFVIMLQILLDYFDYRGYQYSVIDGSTSVEDRQEQMDDFNRPGSEKFIFALSTRAGGLGINLVTADTVIFYDMDFNPQMDFQAEDRAHRIGQLKKVHVFRLLVRGTVEETLYAVSHRKKQLDESVIRRNITKVVMQEATAHHQKALFSIGTIDRAVVEQKLDGVFREISTGEGLIEDCVVNVPAIPRTPIHIDDQSLKRKNDEELIGSRKRSRRSNYFVEE